MRLLVLGSSGFLGRHVAAAAAQREEMEVVSHLHAGGVGSQDDARVLDLVRADASQIRSFLNEVAPEAIVNCVGATGGDPTRLEALNVSLVGRLLDAAGSATPGVRFVQIGSAAEYGLTPPHRVVTEQHVAQPLTGYGSTKLRATRLTLDATQRGSIDGIVLRVFNPVGRGMAPSTLAGNAARQMRAAGRSTAAELRLGRLDAWRDFVDARDVAAAALLAAAISPASERLVNIGSGTAVRARDMVQRLAAIAGFTGVVLEEAAGSSRSEALAWQQADIRLAGRELGWEPRFSLDDALSALWQGLPGDPTAALSKER